MTGIFFLFFGLTGSALMFRHELDQQANPGLHTLRPGIRKAPIDGIYRMLSARYPNLKKIVLHDFPVDARDSYEFMIYKNQSSVAEGYLYYVFVDPYTSDILDEGSYADLSASFWRWLYQFHYSLQMGMPGKLFSAFCGLMMLISLFTGAVIYRKHLWRTLFFQYTPTNKRRSGSHLHRVIGVWSMLLNTLLFFTGFWMNRDFFMPNGWHLMQPIVNQTITANMDSVIHTARAYKGFTPIAVTMPTVPGQPVLVRGKLEATTGLLLQGKASSLSFDPDTGRLIELADVDKKSLADRFEWQVYQLHIGNFGGMFVKIIYVLVGLTPGLLSITGAWLWYKRKYARRKLLRT